LLIERSGHLVRTSELLERLWPNTFVGVGTVARHVSTLRSALAEGGGDVLIETVRKSGYRFAGEAREIRTTAAEERPAARQRSLKILVADDHALFREGLRHVLGRLSEDVEVVEGDCGQALEAAASHPDLALVLLDLFMPGRDGFAALESLCRQYPALLHRGALASESCPDMQRA
jgi:DNA-binding response OmpR family regulator